MKHVRVIGTLLLTVLFLLSLAPVSVAAQSPTVNADDPNRAGTIDNQPHTLDPSGVGWYRFDYTLNHMTGEHPQLRLTLVNGNNSGVDFQVYAPENINGWWNNKPTGRGTIQMIDCETGEPSESGECQSPDLVWQGGFGADGVYWVRVVNSNNAPVSYLLILRALDSGR